MHEDVQKTDHNQWRNTEGLDGALKLRGPSDPDQ